MKNYVEVTLKTELSDKEKYLNSVLKENKYTITIQRYYDIIKLLEQNKIVAICVYINPKYKEIIHHCVMSN